MSYFFVVSFLKVADALGRPGMLAQRKWDAKKMQEGTLEKLKKVKKLKFQKRQFTEWNIDYSSLQSETLITAVYKLEHT